MKNRNLIFATTARLKDLIIHHPQFDIAYQRIIDAYEMKKLADVAQNLICVSESGTGKSTLNAALARNFPAYDDDERRVIPVLVVSTPPFPTIKNMAEEVLVKLGDPLFYKGSAVEKTNRILTYLIKCDVKLVIFDELQHFIDQGKHSSPLQVSDWLKTIIDKANIATVLMGLERSEQILQINEQLRRRFSQRIDLKAFSLASKEEYKSFLSVLCTLQDALRLPALMNLKNETVIQRFHFATNGIIDYMVKLFIGAYEIAINNQLSSLNMECLEEAFTQYIWNNAVGDLNPFNTKFRWIRLDKEGMPFHRFYFVRSSLNAHSR